MTKEAHDAYLSRTHFGSLDGLRAISIAAVVWHHTAAGLMEQANSPWALLGTQGVTLFFAISGFLITTLLLRERARRGAIDLPAFYMRRSLRIFPLYFGVLLLYVALVWLLERQSTAGQAFFHNLPYFLTYTSNLFVPLDGRVIFYFAWSLAAEEQFYLLWPFLLIATRTLRGAAGLLCAALAAGMALQVTSTTASTVLPLAIVAGSLFAVVFHSERGFMVAHRFIGARATPAILAALVVAVWPLNPPAFLTHLLLATLVASCVANEDHCLAPLLRWRPVAFVGTISYGTYMLHMLCKNTVVKTLAATRLTVDGPLLFLLTFCLAVSVASLSFSYFESNFLRLKQRHER